MNSRVEKAIREYAFADALVAIAAFLVATLFFSKLAMEVFAFFMFETMDLFDSTESQAARIRDMAGCKFQPVLTLCISEYLEAHPEELGAFHLHVSSELPFLYRFPASIAGLGFTLFAAAVAVIAFQVVGLSARQDLSRSHRELLSRFPGISSFSAALNDRFQAKLLVAGGIAKPRTVRRSIYVPVSYFLEWRAAGNLSDSMIHSLWHEVAHARTLYPYEGLLMSLRAAYLFLFGIALMPIGIGLLVGPLLLGFTAATARLRHRLLEQAADRLADSKTCEFRTAIEASRGNWITFVVLVGMLSLGALICLLGLAAILRQTIWGDYSHVVFLLSVLLTLFIGNWIWQFIKMNKIAQA